MNKDEFGCAVDIVRQLPEMPDLARKLGVTAYKLISHIPALEQIGQLDLSDADREIVKEHLATLHDFRRQAMDLDHVMNPNPSQAS